MIDKEMAILASVAAKNASQITSMRLATASLDDQQTVWQEWFDFCLARIMMAADDGNGKQQTLPVENHVEKRSNGKVCPDCGGALWDNRKRKADGVMKRNAPDWSCRDRERCGWHSGFVS